MNDVPFRSRTDLESKARALLVAHGALRVPVPVDLLAHRLGLELEETDLGDDVSGVLVIDSERGMIGYSRTQPEVRQRFTIAHEVGHYALHAETGNLFIDKTYVYKRDEVASTGEDRQEIQANLFAAALLMPEELVRRELQKVDFDLADEDALHYLAGRFNVSVQAMSFRLASLGVFEEPDL